MLFILRGKLSSKFSIKILWYSFILHYSGPQWRIVYKKMNKIGGKVTNKIIVNNNDYFFLTTSKFLIGSYMSIWKIHLFQTIRYIAWYYRGSFKTMGSEPDYQDSQPSTNTYSVTEKDSSLLCDSVYSFKNRKSKNYCKDKMSKRLRIASCI